MEQENSNQNEQTKLSFQELLDNDKEYQAEFDKRVQKALTTAKGNWAKEQETTKVVNDNKEIETLLSEVNSLKQYIMDVNAKAENEAKEKELNNRIEEVIKDKTFVNNYTKNAIINEIKAELKTNAKADITELFNGITKDQEGIFVNPNQAPSIPEANANIYKDLDKEAFNKMSYKERLALKQENPDLFKQLNNE